MNVDAEAPGPVTAPESNLHRLSSSHNSHGSIINPSIHRTRSLDDVMYTQTPLRRPTEHYTRLGDRSTVRSCESCSSFDDAGGDRYNYDTGRKFERQDTEYSCDVPKTERQRTEFTCYVPTRRNTIAAQNEPIRYYVPSRGPEKRDAWFPRLVLQDKDPKATQYGASAINPIISSLGLKIKDVQMHSPVVESRSSEQPSSDQAGSSLVRPETELSAVSPRQTVPIVARQQTEFSCDTSQLESQRTSQTKPSPRSTGLPIKPNAVTVPETAQREAVAGRKQTQFSCDPSSSAKSESVVHLSETITGSSATLNVQKPETRVERTVTDFSCYVPDVSTSQNPSIFVAQNESSNPEASPLDATVGRTVTDFSCYVPDVATSQKPSVVETQVESSNPETSLPETRFDRADTEFSCDIPGAASSRKSVIQARVKSANLEVSQLDPRVERKETDFSCYVPGVSTSREASLASDLSGPGKLSLPQAQFARTETEFSCYPGTSISRASQVVTGSDETQRHEPQTATNDIHFSYNANQIIVQNPADRVLESTVQITGSRDYEMANESAPQRFSGLNVQPSRETGNLSGQLVAMTVPSLSFISGQDATVHVGSGQEPQRPNSAFPSTLPQSGSDIISGAANSISAMHASSVEQDLNFQQIGTSKLPRTRVSFQVPSEDLELKTGFLSQLYSEDLTGNTNQQSETSSEKKSVTLTTDVQPISAIVENLTEIPQPEPAASQATPRPSHVRLQSVPEEPTTGQAPARIPSKSKSTFFRNFSQKDQSRKGSNELRNVSSDSSLKETARAPALLASFSRKSVATRSVITNAQVSRSRSSDVDLPQPPISISEAVPTEKVKTPSLRSGSSKRSGVARHALLSTSIGTLTPIDMGLPIAPMLSPDLASASGVGSGMDSLAVKLKHTESLSPTGMPNVSSLPMHRIIQTEVFESEDTNIQNSSVQQPAVTSYMDLFQSRNAEIDTKSNAVEAKLLSERVEAAFDERQEGVVEMQSDQDDVRRVIDSFLQQEAERDNMLLTKLSGSGSAFGQASDATISEMQTLGLNSQSEKSSTLRTGDFARTQVNGKALASGSSLQYEAEGGSMLSVKQSSNSTSFQPSTTDPEMQTVKFNFQSEVLSTPKTGDFVRTQVDTKALASGSSLQYEAERGNSSSAKLNSELGFASATTSFADPETFQTNSSLARTLEVKIEEVINPQVMVTEQVTDSITQLPVTTTFDSIALNSGQTFRKEKSTPPVLMPMDSLPAVDSETSFETASQAIGVFNSQVIAQSSTSEAVAVPGQQPVQTNSAFQVSSNIQEKSTEPAATATENTAASDLSLSKFAFGFPDPPSVTLRETTETVIAGQFSESVERSQIQTNSAFQVTSKAQEKSTEPPLSSTGNTAASESSISKFAFGFQDPASVTLRETTDTVIDAQFSASRDMNRALGPNTVQGVVDLATEISGRPQMSVESMVIGLPTVDVVLNTALLQSRDEEVFSNIDSSMVDRAWEGLPKSQNAPSKSRSLTTIERPEQEISFPESGNEGSIPRPQANQTSMTSRERSESLAFNPSRRVTGAQLDALIEQTLARTESRKEFSSSDRQRIDELNSEQQITLPTEAVSQDVSFSTRQIDPRSAELRTIVDSSLLVTTETDTLIEQSLTRTEPREQPSSYEKSRLQISELDWERQLAAPSAQTSQNFSFSGTQNNEKSSVTAPVRFASTPLEELIEQTLARTESIVQPSRDQSRLRNNELQLEQQTISTSESLGQGFSSSRLQLSESPSTLEISIDSGLPVNMQLHELIEQTPDRTGMKTVSSPEVPEAAIVQDNALMVPLPEPPESQFEDSQDAQSILPPNDLASSTIAFLSSGSFAPNSSPPLRSVKSESGIGKYSSLSSRSNSEPQILEGVGLATPAVRTQSPGGRTISQHRSAEFSNNFQDSVVSDTSKIEIRRSRLWQPSRSDESSAAGSKLWSSFDKDVSSVSSAMGMQDEDIQDADIRDAGIQKEPQQSPSDPTSTIQVQFQSEMRNFTNPPEPNLVPTPASKEILSMVTVAAPSSRISTTAFASGRRPTIAKRVSWKPEDVGLSSTSGKTTFASDTAKVLRYSIEPANVPLPRTTGNTPSRSRNTSQSRIDNGNVSSTTLIDNNPEDFGLSLTSGKESIASSAQLVKDFKEPANVPLPRTTGNTPSRSRNTSQSRIDNGIVSSPPPIDNKVSMINMASITGKTLWDFIQPANVPLPRTTGNTATVTRNASQGQVDMDSDFLPPNVDDYLPKASMSSIIGKAFRDFMEPANVPLPRSTGNSAPVTRSSSHRQDVPNVSSPAMIQDRTSAEQNQSNLTGDLPDVSSETIGIGSSATWDISQESKRGEIPLPATIGSNVSSTLIPSLQSEIAAPLLQPVVADGFVSRLEATTVRLTEEALNTPLPSQAITLQESRTVEVPLPNSVSSMTEATQNSSGQLEVATTSVQETIIANEGLTMGNASADAEATDASLPNLPPNIPSAAQTFSLSDTRPVDIPLPVSVSETRAATRHPSQSRVDAVMNSSSTITDDRISEMRDMINATFDERFSEMRDVINTTSDPTAVPLPRTTGNTRLPTRNVSIQETSRPSPSRVDTALISSLLTTDEGISEMRTDTRAAFDPTIASVPKTTDKNTQTAIREDSVQDVLSVGIPTQSNPIEASVISRYASETTSGPASLPLPASRDDTPIATRNVSVWDFQPVTIPLPASTVNSPTITRQATQTQKISTAAPRLKSRSGTSTVVRKNTLQEIRAMDIPLPISTDTTPARTWDMVNRNNRPQDVPLPFSEDNTPPVTRKTSLRNSRAVDLPLPASRDNMPERSSDVATQDSRPQDVPLPFSEDNTPAVTRNVSFRNSRAVDLPLPVRKDSTAAVISDVTTRFASPLDVALSLGEERTPEAARSASIRDVRPVDIPLPVSKDGTPAATRNVSVQRSGPADIPLPPSRTRTSASIRDARPVDIPLPVSNDHTPAATRNVSIQRSGPADIPMPPSRTRTSVAARRVSQIQAAEPALVPLPASMLNTPVATWDLSTKSESKSIHLSSDQNSTAVATQNISQKQASPSRAPEETEPVATWKPFPDSVEPFEPASIPLPATEDNTPVTSWNVVHAEVNPESVPIPASRHESAIATRKSSSNKVKLEEFGLPAVSKTANSVLLPDASEVVDAALVTLPESKGDTRVATRNASLDRKGSTLSVMALPSVRKLSGDPAPTSDVNVEYWGFVPAVGEEGQAVLQDAVQGAFQESVRKVVQEGIISTDTEESRTLVAYRELIAESLDEAAKTANEYLRRSVHEQTLMPGSYDTSGKEQTFEEIIIDSQIPADQADNSGVVEKSQAQEEELALITQNADTKAKVMQEQQPILDKSTAVRNVPDPRSYTPSQYSVNQSGQDSVSTGHVGGNKVTVEEYERLASMSRLDEPLGEPVANEPESALWKAWNALSGSRKNSYIPIPTRRSSAEAQVTARKPSSKVSPTQMSRVPTGAAYRNLSLGSIKERPRESGSFDFDLENQFVPDEVSGNDSSITIPSPTIKRRRTVHWLRELLSSTEPYATRLTALPPRIERDRWELQRSETAPAKPVEKLFLGATPKPVPTSTQPVEMEVFSKTVLDVEQLLSKALVLARQAAENDKTDVIPVLENAALVLRNGRPDLDNLRQRDVYRPNMKRSEFVSDSYEERMEVGSADESNRSTYSEDRFSIGDDSDGGDREQLLYHRSPLQSEDESDMDLRPVILDPYTSPRKSWAGWPPTGRAATPFPPSSILASTNSNDAGEREINGFLDQETFIQNSLSLQQARNTQPTKIVETGEVELNDFLDQETFVQNSFSLRQQQAENTQSTRVIETTVLDITEPLPVLVRQGSVRDARVRLSKDRGLAEGSGEDAQEVDALLIHTNEQDRAGASEEVKVDPLALLEDIRKQSVPKPPRAPTGSEGRPKTLPDKREVRNFIKEYSQPPIAPRHSSLKLRAMAQAAAERTTSAAHTIPARTKPIRTTSISVRPRGTKTKVIMIQEEKTERKLPGTPPGKTSPVGSSQLSLDGPPEGEIDLGVPQPTVLQNEVEEGIRRRIGRYPAESSDDRRQAARGEGHEGIPEHKAVESHELRELPIGGNLPTTRRYARNKKLEDLNLRGKSHVSLKEHHRFSLGRSKKRQPIARDWSRNRKRFVAAVNCISTALIGILIGIYAGEVPSIQYYLADQHHLCILGNVFLFIGLSIPTMFLWPLPLLHGRKPYILASMSIAMPLLFPQAVVVSSIRSPYVSYYYIGLLLPRALMGFVLGLANMNFQATLLDLFGASLRSGNPHGEDIDEFDVRRHGGGMGVWLGLWTWCYIGSIGLGFTVGAILINYLAPSWGMYISIIILLFISVLNVLTPEVRRGAYRRSVAEVKTEQGISRRVARGEVMMHRVQTGPKWYGQELYHGVMLSVEMLRQPGFLVMAVYQAWIYGQVVLLIVLLGSLISNSYRFKSPFVGLSVAAIPIGAMLAIPFERASIFSRARTQTARTNSNTFETKVNWTSHIVRRAIFTLSLPLMGLGYTLSSYGRPVPFIIPILFAAAFGFLSNMSIAECVGITMETWDTSDLQPGMTGRPRRNSGEDSSGKRTNYSSFPRVAAAFGITQGLGFLIAAVATGVGGVATRNLGQQAATGVMAGILVILTMLFFAVLVRWQDVQIIPNAKTGEMDLYLAQRRLTAMRPPDAPEVEEPWRPTIIGNPKSKTRRMSIIELGSMTRWSEIRRKNRLYDETVAHPDRAVLHQAHQRLQEKQQHVVRSVHGSLRSAHGSLRGRLSRGNSQEGSRRAKGKERQRDSASEDA